MTTHVTTTVETTVELSPRLRQKIAAHLATYQETKAQLDVLEAKLAETRDAIEADFASADAYDTLLTGVRVNDIAIKRVEGQMTKRTDYDGIMRRWKITPKQWAAFVTEAPKKGYLSITLPRVKKDE